MADYGTEIHEFDCGRFGLVQYTQWLHPLEGRKSFNEDTLLALPEAVRAPRSLLVDIGAHTGDTTVPLAVAADPSSIVLAFDPNPHVFQPLCENALLNSGSARIFPVNAAVTGEMGHALFHYSDAGFCNGGYASGLDAGVGATGHFTPLRVRTTKLWPWCEPFLSAGYALRYVKVDAEGRDASILSAEHSLLFVHRPLIQCELYPVLSGVERSLLWSVLHNLLGYRVSLSWDGPGLDEPDLQRLAQDRVPVDLCCTPGV